MADKDKGGGNPSSAPKPHSHLQGMAVHNISSEVAVKGISKAVARSLKKPLGWEPSLAALHVDESTSRHSVHVSHKNKRSKGGSARVSMQSKSVVAQISALLDLEEYDFPDDPDIPDATKFEVKLDVTALDRYNEDVRRIRKLAIDECRTLPMKGDPDDTTLGKIKLTIRALCRTAFYGTHKALVLAEGAVTLITWLLNRRNVKAGIKIHILQSFAEMMWTSMDLKLALYKCRGVKVLANLLVTGVKHRSDLCRWACYTLAMSCISSTECILAVLEIDQIDEVVGEIAFYSYWINWPANFGSILQGILFGPHSVIPMEDTFDFI